MKYILYKLKNPKYEQVIPYFRTLDRDFRNFYPCEIIRINQCEGRIEKSVPRVAVWHHEACPLMTNGESYEGRIFFLAHHCFFYFKIIGWGTGRKNSKMVTQKDSINLK